MIQVMDQKRYLKNIKIKTQNFLQGRKNQEIYQGLLYTVLIEQNLII